MSNLNKMLKQAQKMQKDVERAQNELAGLEVSYASNGVEVIARGDSSISAITISSDLIEAADKEMIEDVVLVAVNRRLFCCFPPNRPLSRL